MCGRELQVVASAKRDAFAIVALRVLVVCGRAMLVGVGEVVGGELVEIGGTITKHRYGEVLQQIRQTGRNVEIHSGRRSNHFQR